MSNTSGASNVFIGNQAGYTNSTGKYNVFLGYYAGNKSTASYNTFLGYQAGKANTSGASNVFLGYNAGAANTSGGSNVFLGNAAGNANTEGERNIFIGTEAGKSFIKGSQNILIGTRTGLSIKSDDARVWNTVIIGSDAAKNVENNIGYSTIIGSFAAEYATGVDNCVFIGHQAGQYNEFETGASGCGYGNVYLGSQAGALWKRGRYNVFVGQDAGGANVGSGETTVFANGTGNIFLGDHAGYRLTTGSYNVFIGYQAGYYQTNTSNKLFISNSSTSSPLIWGDFSTSSVIINGSLTYTSDERFKENIKPLEGSLQKVLNLRGVSYTWKTKAEMAEIRGVTPDSDDFNTRIQEGTQLGVIAQEVEKIVPEVVITEEDGFKSVDYIKLTPVLIEAVKELKAEKDTLQATVESQQSKIDNQQQQIDELKRLIEELMNK